MRARPLNTIPSINHLRTILILWFGLGLFHSYAFQTLKIDSLRSALHASVDDSARIKTCNLLAYHTYRILPDTAKAYARQAMKLAIASGNEIGKANSHNSFGFIAYSRGKYDSAKWHYEQFYQLSESAKDSVSMAKALNNLGVLYRNRGDSPKALASYESSLRIRKAIGSVIGLGPMYNNLGILHKNLGNYQESMDYYLKAIEAPRDPDRMTGRAMAYMNLANLKAILEDYEGSQEAFEQAFSLYQTYGDQKGMAISFHNIAQNYAIQDSIDQALRYFRKSVRIHEALDNPKQLSENFNEIAGLKYRLEEWDSCAYYLAVAEKLVSPLQDPLIVGKIQLRYGKLYRAKGEYTEALSAAEDAYQNFKALRTKKEISASALLISELYHLLGKDSQAYDYLNIHRTYDDSLLNENKVAEIAKIQFNYDLSKVETENEQLIEAQKVLGSTLSARERQVASQRQTILWGGIFLLLVIISVIFIWHFYQEARKTKNSLEEANREISSFNQSLEQKIQERTEKIEKQNEQLMDYAFAISHEIRSPLTNLIGFLDLDDREQANEFSDEEKAQIKNSMADSIQKIDQATRKAAKIGNAKESNLTNN